MVSDIDLCALCEGTGEVWVPLEGDDDLWGWEVCDACEGDGIA